MKLLNPGVNAYDPTPVSKLDKNSIHPQPQPVCPFNLCCGGKSWPINYAVC